MLAILKLRLKLFLFIISLLLHEATFGQSLPNETKKSSPWDSKQFEPRFGLGYQRSIMVEAGVGYHWSGGDIVRPLSTAVYSSLEFSSFSKPVYGVKIGAETIGGMGIGGIDLKYLTNSRHHDLVITPKAGLSIFGTINAFYGYNISTNNYPFENIGKHQFSLILMYSKRAFK